MSPVAQLADWVALQHKGQLIKRTKEPYFNHLLAVAEWAGPAGALCYEIGLCHDLLEDTDTTIEELYEVLLRFGYSVQEASFITSCVVELTDEFTTAAYPDLSKSERKEREAARLLKISPAAQTVKYGDLMYNIAWVLQYDKKHAKKYLYKKQLLLSGLDKGNSELRQQALNAIQRGLIS